MTAIRRIRLPAGVRFDDYSDYQANYINYRTGWLIPNTEVWIGENVSMRINSLGCKGPEPTLGVPVIGVFGDSTTFGSGSMVDSWPAHISVAGYQPLNCGVEGHDLTRIVDRYDQLQPQVNFAAIVVGGSWHNLIYNRTDEAFWTECLDHFGDDRPVVVCTLATAFVPACRARGLDDAIRAVYPNDIRFEAWGNVPTTPEKTAEAYDGVLRYNDFVRRYCERTGRILVDFYENHRPAGYADMATEFLDPAHQRPSIYAALGKAVTSALSPHLAAGEDAGQPVFAPAPVPVAIEEDALHRNVYPLW